MARLSLVIGSKLPRLVDLNSDETSWPDRDVLYDNAGNRLEGEGRYIQVNDRRIRNLGRIRAIAIGYESDWDFVRVGTGDDDMEVLGPGRVIRFPDEGVETLLVLPHVEVPSTRLYDASTFARFRTHLPTQPPVNWMAHDEGGEFPVSTFTNGTGLTQQLYKWNGTKWIADETVDDGEDATAKPAGNGATDRASDWSPDGIWSFADYMEAGLILNFDDSSLIGVAFESVQPIDARGRAGAPASPTSVRYSSPANPPIFSDLSPRFFGRLVLDVWTEDSCPVSGYRPHLAPVRYLRLGELELEDTAAAPDTAILTMPCMNVERVDVRFKVSDDSAGNVFAQLVQPRAEDWIDEVDGVADPDPSTGDLFYTVAPGDTHELLLEEPIGPFIKLNMGAADAGGATIVRGAVVALVRRVS